VKLIAEGKLINTGAGTFHALKYFLYKDTIKVGILFWVIDVGPAIIERLSIGQNSSSPLEISTLSRYTLN